MEILHELGLIDAFGANVPVENPPFPIDFIEDYETLEKRCRMLNPNPRKKRLKRYLFFGSEMGKWLPKDQAWKNVKFIEKLQTVRKYGLSWIGDAIDRVEGRALNDTHFDGCFTKLSQTNPTIAQYENWITGETTFLRNIPNTKLDFDTWYSANFYMEPQTPENAIVPLNEEHRIVKIYRETGSWKKAGVTTQQGKRYLFKVLDYHYSQCLREEQQENQELTPIDSEIAKDFAEVTE